MRRRLMFLALLLGAPGMAAAQHDHAMHMTAAPDAGGAAILVTINPEARVSAALVQPPPPRADCDAPVVLQIRVLNQGGVTAPLLGRLVDAPAGVTMSMAAAPLSGRPDDVRALRILTLKDELTDLTIAFSLSSDPGDLADRDRVHLLVRCTGAGKVRPPG